MPTSDSPNPPKNPSATALTRITNNMVELSKSAKAFEREYPDDREDLISTFCKFFIGLRKHHPDLLPPPPTTDSNALLAELNHLKETLTALQTSVAHLERQIAAAAPSATSCLTLASTSKPASTTSTPSTPPATHPTTLNPSLRPSIIARTTTKDPANHTPPHVLCNTINKSLQFSPHSPVHISSAKWTAKGNLVLTGGHANTLQQLLSARSKISESITSNFPNACERSMPLCIEANVSWSKVLVNNVPTGVSSNRGPWTPDECHEALTADNPRYARLNIMQKPSWVKHPDAYGENTTSSLVFAFEDLEGCFTRDLINSKSMYIFGTRATVKPWVDRRAPIHANPRSPKTETSASPPTPPNSSPNYDPPVKTPDPAPSPEQVATLLDEDSDENKRLQDFNCEQILQQILEEEERAAKQAVAQSQRKTRARQTNPPKPSKTRNPQAEPPPGLASASPNPATHPTIRQAPRGRIKA
ncbi:hypothetical protein EDB85DRAFT_2146044 [Lactarius pseudohatsudake]|nr:hypothetical protein EDB85DRAFT_2146044 [Lactarius pseudohatsudake]